jgi:hypothetical protein
MLTGTGFRDHALLPHPPCQQCLTERVVDLVRAGMREVFALQKHARAGALRQARCLVQRRRPAHVMLQEMGELVAERRILPRRQVSGGELLDRRDQRLRHESPTVLAEVAAGIGIPTAEHRALARGCRHHFSMAPLAGRPTSASALAAEAIIAVRAAARNRATFSGFFTPGASSTPDDTSTP